MDVLMTSFKFLAGRTTIGLDTRVLLGSRQHLDRAPTGA